jgi:hypothetical protein
MDSAINVNRLSRVLHRRGTHRLLGNPFLGSLTAFLTVLILIRVAANFSIISRISDKSSRIDAVQVASAHLVFLSAYAVWVGALASCRISLALPRLSFVSFAPFGRRFRSKFTRRAALLRPMNIASLSIMLLTVIVFSIICGCWQSIMVRGLMVLSLTSIAVIFVTALASRFVRSRSDIQILETLYLLLLVSLNPDIGTFKGLASVFFRGNYFSFSGVLEVGCTVALVVMVAVVVLLLVRALSAMNNLFGRQISLSPMERWYWRFFRIRSWAFIYAVVTPIFISRNVSLSTQRWTLFLSIVFGVASYLYFVSHCENILHERWRCSLSDKGNIKLMARSALVHVVLMTIPVLEYFFIK